jgi:hypothetical protein
MLSLYSSLVKWFGRIALQKSSTTIEHNAVLRYTALDVMLGIEISATFVVMEVTQHMGTRSTREIVLRKRDQFSVIGFPVLIQNALCHHHSNCYNGQFCNTACHQ